MSRSDGQDKYEIPLGHRGGRGNHRRPPTEPFERICSPWLLFSHPLSEMLILYKGGSVSRGASVTAKPVVHSAPKYASMIRFELSVIAC